MTTTRLYGLPRSEEDIAADPQPGDIYRTSWGYDQTNTEFFEVVRRTKATVTVRRIEARMGNRDHGEEAHRVYPVPGVYARDVLIESDAQQFDPVDGWSNPVRDRAQEVGYTEKVCRLQRPSPGSTSKYALPGWVLRIGSVRRAYPYSSGGGYDTLAAGHPGH